MKLIAIALAFVIADCSARPGGGHHDGHSRLRPGGGGGRDKGPPMDEMEKLLAACPSVAERCGVVATKPHPTDREGIKTTVDCLAAIDTASIGTECAAALSWVTERRGHRDGPHTEGPRSHGGRDGKRDGKRHDKGHGKRDGDGERDGDDERKEDMEGRENRLEGPNDDKGADLDGADGEGGAEAMRGEAHHMRGGADRGKHGGHHGHPRFHKPLVIGLSVGGAVLLLVIIALCIRRRRRVASKGREGALLPGAPSQDDFSSIQLHTASPEGQFHHLPSVPGGVPAAVHVPISVPMAVPMYTRHTSGMVCTDSPLVPPV